MATIELQTCLEEIKAYTNGEKTGHVLIVNTESYDVYQQIWERVQTDPRISCIAVSSLCNENIMPRVDDILLQVQSEGLFALTGLSQYVSFQGTDILKSVLLQVLELPIKGHAVILLEHCQQLLKEYLAKYKKFTRRVLLVEGEASVRPLIRIAGSAEMYLTGKPSANMHELLRKLEKRKDGDRAELLSVLPFPINLFQRGAYPIADCETAFESLQKSFPEDAMSLEAGFGTEEQWKNLFLELRKHYSFSAIIDERFGSTVNLASHLEEVYDNSDPLGQWYLWLGMKVFGTKGYDYLTRVMASAATADDFIERVYFHILDYNCHDRSFAKQYAQRKRLIAVLPEAPDLMARYCTETGKKGKDAVYYLTDLTEQEEYEFARCLSVYEYTEKELDQITKVSFPEINSYLKRFSFTAMNTKLAEKDADLRDVLTQYFVQYKLQKLTNRIYPQFMQQVEEFAAERPYNHLQARSAIIKSLPKNHVQPIFFDALGVEYLSYIQDKCKEMNLITEISVGRCFLPSITAKNKEFENQFPVPVLKNEELDELKHHDQVIDYEKCKLPVHVFRELEIIKQELRRIDAKLKQGDYEKAVIVSDHGASRLAVIHETENSSSLVLEEKGKHSGRCCPVAEDPQIPFAAYEDGYAVLANYDRFKGSRKANVEVHGGASLEEVLVPVIMLSRVPDEVEIYFINPIVEIKGKEPASILLYSNIPLKEPLMMIGETQYKGTFQGDSRHILFSMPDIKRSRKNIVADIYDGDQKIADGLVFDVKKATSQERDFF